MITPQVHRAIDAVEGVIGVFARRLAHPSEIAHRADETFVTASVFKIPVLIELYRQADAGRIDLQRRVTVEERHRINGTGVLQELTAGLELTIRDLAMLMIIVSDNVATDMLLDLVGKEHVNSMLQDVGLAKTLIRKTSKELLFNVTGMDPNNPAHAYDENRRRVKSLQLDPAADGLSIAGSNVSTPRETGQLLLQLARGELLSPVATDEVLDILARQNYNEMIPALLPPGTRVAHKTGTLTLPTGSVRTDAGIVYHPKYPFVVVCFTRDLPTVNRGVEQIARLSRAIYDSYTAA